jgi:DtxR family Mn-dependent transcriptional regulator
MPSIEKLLSEISELRLMVGNKGKIKREKLIEKLDAFLGYPKVDPHGDPIPDKNGVFAFIPNKRLSDVEVGQKCKMVSVKDNSVSFLHFVAELGLKINKVIEVKSIEAFDSTIEIEIDNKINRVSLKFAQNIYVE